MAHDAVQPQIDQWQAVEAFFADFANPDGSQRRAYARFEHPSDLCEQLRDVLVRLVEKRLTAAMAVAPSASNAANKTVAAGRGIIVHGLAWMAGSRWPARQSHGNTNGPRQTPVVCARASDSASA